VKYFCKRWISYLLELCLPFCVRLYSLFLAEACAPLPSDIDSIRKAIQEPTEHEMCRTNPYQGDSTTQIDLCPSTDLTICHQLCRLNMTRLRNPPPEGSISADSGQMQRVGCYGAEVTRFRSNSA
jgi:hypothetical protein